MKNKGEKTKYEVDMNMVEESLESKKGDYPCEPFDFVCPKKETCGQGQNCPWKK